LPVPVKYDWYIVLLSLLVGIIGSAAALLEAIRQSGNLVNYYPSRRSAGHTDTRTCHDA
jgi:hypothetical protein